MGGSNPSAIGTRPRRSQHLRHRLLSSHLTIALVALGILLSGVGQILWLRTNLVSLASVREPTVRAATLALSGLERSVAALRGWLVTPDPAFKRERARAWASEIEPALASLEELSNSWTEPGEREQLAELSVLLGEYRDAQQRIEQAAYGVGTASAEVVSKRRFGFLAEVILATTRRISTGVPLDVADPLERDLHERLTEFSAAFALANGELVQLLRDGQKARAASVRLHLAVAGAAFDAGARASHGLRPPERHFFAGLQAQFATYRQGVEELLATRPSHGWSVAELLLVAEGEPLGRRATEILAAMSTRQHEKLRADADYLMMLGDAGIAVLLALMATLGVATWLLSLRAAERITQPLAALARAASDLTSGRAGDDIPVMGDDELAHLTRAFNTMRASVSESQRALSARAEELTQACGALQAESLERQAAEETSRRLAAIVEHSEDAIIGKTLDGIVTSWNVGAERIYGYTAAEMCGRSAGVLLASDRGDEEARILDTIRSGGRLDHYETKRVRKDGSEVDVSLTASAIRDGTGRITGVSTVARDVSARVRAEAVVHKLNAELEQRVLERTADLTLANVELDRLRRQQLALKDRLLSHVTHELRTPLNAINGYLTLLQDELAESATSEQRGYLDNLTNNANQLDSMISDLLDATRAENAKLVVEPRRIELVDVIRETLESVRPAAAAKHVRLAADLPRSLPTVHADSRRARQILTNLLDNAIKFTPPRGRVSVKAHDGDVAGFVRITVADTGCGVSAESRERIFERLHQEENARGAARKGLGLGLYICRALVARQGGRIWVESEPGRGSAFSFTLPTSDVAAAAERPDQRKACG